MSAPLRRGSMPRMLSSPSLIGEVQPIMRIVEVLPAPFGPRNPNASPGATSKSTAVDGRERTEPLRESAGSDQRFYAVPVTRRPPSQPQPCLS